MTLRIKSEAGFSLIEVLVAAVIFPLIVYGLYNAHLSVNQSYAIARQYNEIYAVLTACPELDRALEFSSITQDNNCFPNNTFKIEGGKDGVVTYNPNLQIFETNELDPLNPLAGIPDTKIISIDVELQNAPNAPPIELSLLVSRNGLGQQ